MAQNATTAAPEQLANDLSDEGMTAEPHGSAEEESRTVVVERDASEDPETVERLAADAGYFVFASDASEVTLSAYADCAWKTAPSEVEA
jgi:hypothetical protein